MGKKRFQCEQIFVSNQNIFQNDQFLQQGIQDEEEKTEKLTEVEFQS